MSEAQRGAPECHFLRVADEDVWFVGPPTQAGALPALFYLSLAGEESLVRHPYNSPVELLQHERIRIFSMTLPGHGDGFDPTVALAYWANELKEGRNHLLTFFSRASRVIDRLIQDNLILLPYLATAGLSRGALVATHLAARDSRIRAVCGFAPWVEPGYSSEFHSIAALNEVTELALFQLIPKLAHTHIRFYVGNRDTAVGTDRVFAFIRELAEYAYGQRIRSPKAELMITPSIGHRGHGTSGESFKEGALWLKGVLSE